MRGGVARKVLAGIAAAVLLTGAAGCGDDSDEPAPATSTAAESDSLSKEEYIAAADGICTETSEAVNAEIESRFPADEGASASEEGLVAFFTEVTLPELRGQFDQIAALPPPAGDEEAVGAILDEADQAISESEANPELLLVLQGASTPFDEVNRLSQEFGFEVCGAAEADGG